MSSPPVNPAISSWWRFHSLYLSSFFTFCFAISNSPTQHTLKLSFRFILFKFLKLLNFSNLMRFVFVNITTTTATTATSEDYLYFRWTCLFACLFNVMECVYERLLWYLHFTSTKHSHIHTHLDTNLNTHQQEMFCQNISVSHDQSLKCFRQTFFKYSII